jgi:hypothetical protein
MVSVEMVSIEMVSIDLVSFETALELESHLQLNRDMAQTRIHKTGPVPLGLSY